MGFARLTFINASVRSCSGRSLSVLIAASSAPMRGSERAVPFARSCTQRRAGGKRLRLQRGDALCERFEFRRNQAEGGAQARILLDGLLQFVGRARNRERGLGQRLRGGALRRLGRRRRRRRLGRWRFVQLVEPSGDAKARTSATPSFTT